MYMMLETTETLRNRMGKVLNSKLQILNNIKCQNSNN